MLYFTLAYYFTLTVTLSVHGNSNKNSFQIVLHEKCLNHLSIHSLDDQILKVIHHHQFCHREIYEPTDIRQVLRKLCYHFKMFHIGV